jgi:hypothetical protein
MGPGPLIAIYVLLLYAFLAPLVLLGIFVLFDVLGRSTVSGKKPGIVLSIWKKDPAVWTARDITEFQDRN